MHVARAKKGITMKFHRNYNNGVVAVISAAEASDYAKIKKAGGSPVKCPTVSVFTFCSRERMEQSVTEKMTFTGTVEDLEKLMEGHEFASCCGDWDGYVPFSNGIQYGAHGDDSKERELKYLTTLSDVIRVFGMR
jgi:hypothetical protein